jgi:hypothetical protein
MKLILLFLLAPLFLSPKQESKMDLLCHKWKQIGIKKCGEEYQSVDSTTEGTITIRKDGTYEKEFRAGKLRAKGQWMFNKDSTKLGFAIMEVNGRPTPFTLTDANLLDTIVRLSKDTLIYGFLRYYHEGDDWKRCHEDGYFIRDK